jgi:hypothetical protein
MVNKLWRAATIKDVAHLVQKFLGTMFLKLMFGFALAECAVKPGPANKLPLLVK